jgi:2-polyprenyl-3-methyl-5-hydroxy-6-metoxy-1,4-benzoquinol methylase
MCTHHTPTPDALSERLFQSALGTLELFSIYLGRTLGLYEALDEAGPLTPSELAERADIAERYALEWLEQQAVAGLLETDDSAGEHRFLIPEGHRPVLCEPVHAAHVSPFAELLVGVANALPAVADAYRTGNGVPYATYGEAFRQGQAAINRPAFTSDLTGSWLPAIPEVHERLTSGEPVRVADVACGQGWSTIAVADAFPSADVVGFDLDAPSVSAARQNASDQESRARFQVTDGGELEAHGPFDVVLLIEALHDMSRPHETLASIRRALAPGGTLIVADERVADAFSPNGDAIERMMYGWSISHCLPVSMAEQPSRALGTVLRQDTVKDLASEAGFAACEVLGVEHEIFRFYRMSG